MKTAFDDYACPSDITLHDPSPPSALRMVFLRTDGRQASPGDLLLLGQIMDNGDTIRVIRRMGDPGVTVRNLTAAIRLLRG